MFLLEDSRRKGVWGVLISNPNGALFDDGPTVQTFVDQVYGASSNANSVFKCLALGIEPWEGR